MQRYRTGVVAPESKPVRARTPKKAIRFVRQTPEVVGDYDPGVNTNTDQLSKEGPLGSHLRPTEVSRRTGSSGRGLSLKRVRSPGSTRNGREGQRMVRTNDAYSSVVGGPKKIINLSSHPGQAPVRGLLGQDASWRRLSVVTGTPAHGYWTQQPVGLHLTVPHFVFHRHLRLPPTPVSVGLLHQTTSCAAWLSAADRDWDEKGSREPKIGGGKPVSHNKLRCNFARVCSFP